MSVFLVLVELLKFALIAYIIYHCIDEKEERNTVHKTSTSTQTDEDEMNTEIENDVDDDISVLSHLHYSLRQPVNNIVSPNIFESQLLNELKKETKILNTLPKKRSNGYKCKYVDLDFTQTSEFHSSLSQCSF